MRVSGLISNVFVADTDGTFDRPPDAHASAAAAWNALRVSLDSGDANSALQFISTPMRSHYAAAFSVLGSRLTTMSGDWSDIDAVTVQPEYAIFTLNRTYNGQTRLHFITLSFEGGQWRVHSF